MFSVPPKEQLRPNLANNLHLRGIRRNASTYSGRLITRKKGPIRRAFSFQRSQDEAELLTPGHAGVLVGLPAGAPWEARRGLKSGGRGPHKALSKFSAWDAVCSGCGARLVS